MKNNDFKELNERGYKIIPIGLKTALKKGYTTAEEVEAKLDSTKGYFFILNDEEKKAFCIYNPKGIKTSTYKRITLYKELNKEDKKLVENNEEYKLIIYSKNGEEEELTFNTLEDSKPALKLEQARGSTYKLLKINKTATGVKETILEDSRKGA